MKPHFAFILGQVYLSFKSPVFFDLCSQIVPGLFEPNFHAVDFRHRAESCLHHIQDDGEHLFSHEAVRFFSTECLCEIVIHHNDGEIFIEFGAVKLFLLLVSDIEFLRHPFRPVEKHIPEQGFQENETSLYRSCFLPGAPKELKQNLFGINAVRLALHFPICGKITESKFLPCAAGQCVFGNSGFIHHFFRKSLLLGQGLFRVIERQGTRHGLSVRPAVHAVRSPADRRHASSAR